MFTKLFAISIKLFYNALKQKKLLYFSQILDYLHQKENQFLFYLNNI